MNCRTCQHYKPSQSADAFGQFMGICANPLIWHHLKYRYDESASCREYCSRDDLAVDGQEEQALAGPAGAAGPGIDQVTPSSEDL